MRSAPLLALAALASAGTALPSRAATSWLAPSRATPTSTVPAFDLTDVAFKEKLKKAVASGKKPELESLVHGDSTQAAAWILRLSEVLLDRDDPNEKALRDGLVEGWAAAIQSNYPTKIADYLKSLDDAKRRTRTDLRKRLTQAWNDLEQNRDQKDGLMFVQTAEELDLLAGAFETEGDLYSASEAHIALAMCLDEPLRGTDAEPHKAWIHWTRVAELRGQLELKDERFAEAEKRRADLAKKGYDKPDGPAAGPDKGGEKGGEKGGKAGKGGEVPAGPATPPSEGGNPVTVALTFEALASPDAFVRPCYQADEIYALWNPMPLAAKGSTSKFDRLGADSPVLHRLGSSDLRFDVDFDGKGDGPADQKIGLTGTLTPFRLQIGKGESARPWAFFAVTGIEKDVFQGIGVNLQSTDASMTIYTLSAASVVGNLAGTPIRLIDDSMDGVYGSEILTFGYGGLANGSFQPEMDSIVVGAAKRARPWSQYQEVGGSWWKFEAGSKGKEVHATPAKLETGILKLEVKGLPPNCLVVRGANELKDAYFDLVEGGAKGLAVPAGRYSLFYGEVSKGKKSQLVKALILPGRASGNYDVRAGATTVVTLGAPYGFDFTARNDAGKVTIVGQSVVVTGSGGERYERAWNCVPRPEVSWRKKGSKKGTAAGKLSAITDQESLYKRGNQGWLDVWFPLDLEFDAKGAGDVEIQLVDEKHKLFGKVESAWKE
ncbi:MAG: hypothetical protein NTY35_15215 [Planctomycetota bacterium]|nr:hypothetical protein [Planctomycetota bacterium]